MHWTQIVGSALLAAPFFGLFIVIARETSILEAFGAFGATLAMVLVIAIGVALVSGSAA